VLAEAKQALAEIPQMYNDTTKVKAQTTCPRRG
jgi:hypothetical protein